MEKTNKSSNRRSDIRIGQVVKVIRKQDQQSGALTEGIIKKILTNSPQHPHGIKVMLDSGEVGRVQHILEDES